MSQPVKHYKPIEIFCAWSFACVFLLALGGVAAAQPTGADDASSTLSTAWGQRDSPEHRERVARDFLDKLILGDEQLRITNLIRRPGMVRVNNLAKQGKHAEAMEAYAAHFFAKLRRPEANGVRTKDVDPFTHHRFQTTFGPGKPERIIAAAEQRLRGELTLKGEPVNIGLPGSVNWNYPHPKDQPLPLDQEPHGGLKFAASYFVLAHAYVLTKDQRYLDGFVAFIDDWSMNSSYYDRIHPCKVPTASNNGYFPILRMTRVLHGIARVSDDPTPMPGRVLAQVIDRLVFDIWLVHLAYIRSNTHNWTPTALGVSTAMIYDEFRATDRLLRESLRRQIEDHAVTQNLPDGTENQQCPWYNENYLKLHDVFDILHTREAVPMWEEVPAIAQLRRDVGWRNELRQHLADHVTYLIHLRTPDNEWPIPMRGGDKRNALVPSDFVSPLAYQDPTNRAILGAVRGAPVDPGYHSEWFPYAGYNLVRAGWHRSSAHGSMFTAPHPGSYGGYRSRSNNNTLGLAAFGQDLIVEDTLHHYMYPSSPITVDGHQQNFHAGIHKVAPPSDHKTYQVSAWDQPADWRWHASERFNLMEGVYDGHYGGGNDRFTGVTHQRLALYLRASGIWVVADVMQSDQPRTYEMTWMLPQLPEFEGNMPAFQPDDIHIDELQSRIYTDQSAPNTRKVNVSLHQFAAERLTYQRKDAPAVSRYGRRVLYGRAEIGAAWSAGNASAVVTAIVPRPAGTGMSTDLKNVRRLNANKGSGDITGFTAETAEGQDVTFLIAAQGASPLSLPGLSAHAEALLCVDDAGVVLGARTLIVDGKRIDIPTPDFKFARNGGDGGVTITPIYRPIKPVRIEPGRNVFHDSLDVTLHSETPGVVIRYTLDGTEVTPHSERYTGPITITRSATVTARAYRPGVTENPKQLSGTHATVPARAVFQRRGLASAGPDKQGAGGLAVHYFEADWKTLWLGLDRLKPVASGRASGLWDLSVIPADNASIGEAVTPRQRFYAVRYEGRIVVPESGVYTFHAPREYMWPDTAAGYDLRLYVGEQRIPWGARTKVIGLQEWSPATRPHAFGTWSVALQAGAHPIRVEWIDVRTDAAGQLNRPHAKDYIWNGTAPELLVSGPGMKPQPIPDDWLKR